MNVANLPASPLGPTILGANMYMMKYRKAPLAEVLPRSREVLPRSRDHRTKFEVPQLNEVYESFFDDADNITRIDKTVGAGTPVTIESFTSDPDGNLLTRTDPATSVVTTYQWDDFNRLKAISTTDNSKKQTNTFGVNGFRRKKKDKNNVETTEYANGLATAVSKVNGGDTITYLMGHQIMGFERSSDGAMFFFLPDALSSVRDVVSSTGAVVASYEFSEYGQKISPANTGGVESQKTFVGGLSVQDEVADTGLMMMGHRFYSPELGRFLNRDPIGFRGGLNLFEYASSAPTWRTDSKGLQDGPMLDSPYEGPLGRNPATYSYPGLNQREKAWLQEALAIVIRHDPRAGEIFFRLGQITGEYDSFFTTKGGRTDTVSSDRTVYLNTYHLRCNERYFDSSPRKVHLVATLANELWHARNGGEWPWDSSSLDFQNELLKNWEVALYEQVKEYLPSEDSDPAVPKEVQETWDLIQAIREVRNPKKW